MLSLALVFTAPTLSSGASSAVSRIDPLSRARILVVEDAQATQAFEPQLDRVRAMVHKGITNWTGLTSVSEAWLSLVTTQDTIGLKVFSVPGPRCGTRPAVVAAVVEDLITAGILPRQIIVWDKHQVDLRRAGFEALETRYGIQVKGSAEAGYDEQTFYDTQLLGQLVWGDMEFGKKGEGIGRKSFVSKLVTKQITKIINITPLLNNNSVGVAGNVFGLAVGSVDNIRRFESDPGRLASAVPEIFALPTLGDRVVLNIVDALICQYEGEVEALLHYCTPLNELRFGKDPVALDVYSFQELERQRKSSKTSPKSKATELFQNASLLELGISDPANIQVDKVQ